MNGKNVQQSKLQVKLVGWLSICSTTNLLAPFLHIITQSSNTSRWTKKEEAKYSIQVKTVSLDTQRVANRHTNKHAQQTDTQISMH